MTMAIIVAMSDVVVVAIGGLALLWMSRRKRRRANALPVITPEGLRIPVNAIFTRSGGPIGVAQHNNFRPELAIGPDGIRFRAMTRKHWPFDAVAHVEARARRGGWKLVFVGRQWGTVLVADMIGEANALAALRALPDGLVLTPQAALLRNGSAAAGTEGLRLYRGRMR